MPGIHFAGAAGFKRGEPGAPVQGAVRPPKAHVPKHDLAARSHEIAGPAAAALITVLDLGRSSPPCCDSRQQPAQAQTGSHQKQECGRATGKMIHISTAAAVGADDGRIVLLDYYPDIRVVVSTGSSGRAVPIINLLPCGNGWDRESGTKPVEAGT